MDPDSPEIPDDRLIEHASYVRGLVRALVRDEDAANDLAQSTLAAALEHPPRSGGRLQAWLAGIARNLVRMRAREERIRREHAPKIAASTAPPAGAPSAFDVVERIDSVRTVIEELRALTRSDRVVLYLRYFEGLSLASIAQRLKVPAATVRTRHRRALERLRERLDRRFGSRGTWCLGLAALGGLRKGVVAMAVKTKITLAIGAAAVLVAAWALWPVRASRTEPKPAPAVALEEARGEAPAGVPPAEGPAIFPEPRPLDASPAVVAEPPLPFAFATFHGRVVDEHRFPVAAAEVVLDLPPLGPFNAVTDVSGRFEIRDVPRGESDLREGSVYARDSEGTRAGMRYVQLSPREWREAEPYRGFRSNTDDELDLGVVVLEQSWPLEVRVVDAGGAVEGAEVVAESGLDRVTCDVGRTDANGAIRLLCPKADLLVDASFPGLRGRARCVVPDDAPGPIVVRLDRARSIEVRTIDPRDGSAVPGVEVRLEEEVRPYRPIRVGSASPRGWRWLDFAIPPTDEDGETRVNQVPADGRFRLIATKRNYCRPELGKHDGLPVTRLEREIDANTDTVVFELVPAPSRTVRIPVVEGEAGIPEEGATITLRRLEGTVYSQGMDLPATGRMEDGHVVLDGIPGDGWFLVLGEAPDGSLAPLGVEKGNEIGFETSFRRPRTIEAVVRTESGEPVAGALLDARDQGMRRIAAPVETGPDGHARLEGLYGDLTDVYIVRPERTQRHHVGTYDLSEGDASIEFILPSPCRIPFQVSVEGVAGLPARLYVNAFDPGQTYPIVEEDPEAGRLVVEAYPRPAGDVIQFGLGADGFYGHLFDLPVESVDPEAPIPVDFVRLASIVVTVVRPPGARVDIYLERWDERLEKWDHSHQGQRNNPTGPRGTWVFIRPHEGRYRILERWSQITTEAFDVATMPPGDIAVTVDLGNTRMVTGSVEAPAGMRLDLVRVLAIGEGLDAVDSPGPRWDESSGDLTWGRGHRVDGEGRFSVRLPDDRRVVLRAWHPFLSPAAKGGEVALPPGPVEGVVLRLVEGDVAVLPVPAEIAKGVEAIRVLAFDAGVAGAPRCDLMAPIVEADGAARFSGLPPGRYNLWVDPGRDFAPFTLRAVEIVPGETILPALAWEQGSSVRIRLHPRRGEAPPRIGVFFSSVTDAIGAPVPVYYRRLLTWGEEEAVLAGLGAGTFDVWINDQSGGDVLFRGSVTLDGVNERTIDLEP